MATRVRRSAVSGRAIPTLLEEVRRLQALVALVMGQPPKRVTERVVKQKGRSARKPAAPAKPLAAPELMKAVEGNGGEMPKGTPKAVAGPIVFEELPEGEDAGSRTSWRSRLKPLVARPGQWARVMEYGRAAYANSAAQRCRSDESKLPPGEWEFAARTVDEHHYLYARYLGEPQRIAQAGPRR